MKNIRQRQPKLSHEVRQRRREEREERIARIIADRHTRLLEFEDLERCDQHLKDAITYVAAMPWLDFLGAVKTRLERKDEPGDTLIS